MEYKLSGLPQASPDAGRQEIKFTFAVSNGRPLSFVGKLGVVGQVIAGLARTFEELRSQLEKTKAVGEVGGEQIAAYQIQRAAPDIVLLRLTTPQGIPYSFRVPPQIAGDMAARLKRESDKQVGRA